MSIHSIKRHVQVQTATHEEQETQREWILVRGSRDDECCQWLLIKAGKDVKLSAEEDNTSIFSGRSLARIAQDNDAQWNSNR